MTLYDITVIHQETTDEDGLRRPYGTLPHKRIRVEVTPYRQLIVPPGSTLVMKKDAGPEAHLTGDGVHLVHKGESYYTQDRIIDGFHLEQLGTEDGPRYLAAATEDLIVEALRSIAETSVKEIT